MSFLKRYVFAALVGALIFTSFMACEEDVSSIGGDGIVSEEPFVTGSEVFDVFAYNRRINAVQANRLPIYQLGVFNDPVYGRTEASITTQVQLSANQPTFGARTQAFEDEAEAAADPDVLITQEEETVTDVFLYIPYLRVDGLQVDADNDGVDDEFDAEPDNPDNDSDNDGLTNNQERVSGTDPLNPDTDGDGINDGDDDATLSNTFPRRFQLDSIFGDREAPFQFTVRRSTFFLRDLDPDTDFQEAQEFFSSQEFAPGFVSDVLFDGEITIDDEEILFFEDDDPDTEDIDESLMVETRLPAGIRVPLDPQFFQENILDLEGGSELLSVANFREFFRGIHISLTPTTEELMILLDLTQANITINYTNNRLNNNGTSTDTSDDMVETEERQFVLNLLTGGGPTTFLGLNPIPIVGNAVNTFINDPYPAEITDQLDTGENAERIYVKGGSGSYAEIKLFNENNGREEIEQIIANNWIINEANLIFHVDRATLDASGSSGVEPLRLYLYDVDQNRALFNILLDSGGSDTPLGIFPNHDGILAETNGQGTTYTIRITEYMNELVLRDAENATLALTVTSDIRVTNVANAMLNGDVDRDLPLMSTINPLGTVLFGSNVAPENEDQRLRLEIFYTEVN